MLEKSFRIATAGPGAGVLTTFARSSFPCICVLAVPRQAAYTLFDLAADVSGCAGYAIFIHGSDASRHRCALACSS